MCEAMHQVAAHLHLLAVKAGGVDSRCIAAAAEVTVLQLVVQLG